MCSDQENAQATGIIREYGLRRWIWLFSGGVGLAMLLTAVPLFLAPLRAGLANNLFPQHYVTFAYFVAYALTMGVYLFGIHRGRVPRALTFGPVQALVGTLGCALLVAGRIVLNTIHDTWVAAGQPAGQLIVPDWVDPLRWAGAALSAFVAACALLSSYRLLRRLEPERATIACVGSFTVLAVLTTISAHTTGPVSPVLYAFVPALAYVLLRAADANVPYSDLSTIAGATPHVRSGIPTRADTLRYCALFGTLFLLGLWALEFSGSHKAGDNGYLMVPVFAPLALTAFAIGCWLTLGRRHAVSYALLCRISLPVLGLCTLLIYLPSGAGPTRYFETLASALALAALLLSDMTAWCVDLARMRGAGLASERLFVLQRVTLCGALLAADIVYGMNFDLYVKLKIGIGLLAIALCVVTFCFSRPGYLAQQATLDDLDLSAGVPIRASLSDVAGTPRTTSSQVLESGTSDPVSPETPSSSAPSWADAIATHGLTARESEVFSLLMEGLDAQGIATKLGISRTTVNTHTQHIYAKFDVHSYKELSRAVRQ
ncbi:MAG: hypothetical protein KHZ24_06100 [Coriobacteriia bacterium]|nr:hypothetical protein [Coriobacteriia bacterium]